MSFMASLRRRLPPGEMSAWRAFAMAMGVLALALLLALASAAASEMGRVWLAAGTAFAALALAGWVAVTIVPTLARRSSLRWLTDQVDYRLTREGLIYLGAVLVLLLAAVNTGNNLLFLVLACLLAGILVSGILSRIVLSGVELQFDLPEHVFAGQPVLACVQLINEKLRLPSFSLCVTGSAKNPPGAAEILSRRVYFPYVPHRSSVTQRVEVLFPRRGRYHQESLSLRTRFPFGFLEKSRRIDWHAELIVYPRVEPTEAFYELLPLLSGEIASFYRGRGHELHSIREFHESDSARSVDWKVTARTGSLKVREYAREDERRVMIVLDPFRAPVGRSRPSVEDGLHRDRFERAVTLAACLAWHFSEIQAVAQLRTARASTPMAPTSEIIYAALRELALIEPEPPGSGGDFLDTLAADPSVFKIIFTERSRGSIPTGMWTSSYFIFLDSL
jgi:uncharacterized protein (DUF58 family)